MALLPEQDNVGTFRENQIAFRGYNHNLYVGEQEFYETRNLTSAYFPVLSPRSPRARVRTFSKFNGMHEKNGLVWVDGTTLYHNGEAITTVEDSPKQFVTMGAYVLIWPDKKCYNTHDGAVTDLGARVELTGASFALSRLDGDTYGTITASDVAPASPSNGQYWVDTLEDTHALKVYSEALGVWSTVATTYVKISAPGLGTTFKQYDGVTIEGVTNAQFTRAGTDYVVMAAGDGWITVVGILDAGFTADISVERRVPDMDFVTQSENRVWGCSSAKHEIYSCKQGDPTNWYCYQGLSTDSYAATVGTDGDFTGAITHMGYVLFFKERCIHKVFGSRPSNFQITNNAVRGVKAGAEGSLAIVNETLYYLSPSGVCSYDGGLPMSVSDALGKTRYVDGVAGASGNQYVVSLTDGAGGHGLFTYDERSGVWLHDDDTRALAFADDGQDLYFVDAAGVLWAMGGTIDPRYADDEAEREPEVTWMAETGDLGTDTPDNGYIGRIQMRLEIEPGAHVYVDIMYESDGKWKRLERIGRKRKQAIAIEAAPYRCDHFKLRLGGAGPCKIYSIARVREEATEL